MIKFDVGNVQTMGLIELDLIKSEGIINGEEAYSLTDIGKKMMVCVWYYNQLSHEQKEVLSAVYSVSKVKSS